MALVHNDAATSSYSEANADAKKLRLLSFLYPESAHLLFSVPEKGGCRCPRDGKINEPSSLKDLIPLLTSNPRLFGYSDDHFSFGRERKILEFYRTLSQGPALSAPGAGRPRQLSLVQIQEGLIEGDIRAALVMSASPMPLINECLQADHPRLGRTRLRSASRGEKCPCGEKLPGSYAIRVLPLDVPEPAQPGTPPVPRSLRGLVKRNPLLKTDTIPPDTYVGAQRDEVPTVSVEVVLICREDLSLEAGISGVLGALYDDEVRLRAVVKEVDLRDPLAASVKDPSIPLHPEARSFYEEKGVLQPIPRPKTLLTIQNLLYALGNVCFLLLGILAPSDWRQVIQRFLLRFVLSKEKRKNALEDELRSIYFKDEVPPQAKVEQIEKVMDQVLRECGAGHLSHAQAENLDLLARDYLERLDKTLDWRDRVPRPETGPTQAADVR
jgi:hypothetical protein